MENNASKFQPRPYAAVIFAGFLLLVFVWGIWQAGQKKQPAVNPSGMVKKTQSSQPVATSTPVVANADAGKLLAPISKAQERVTKKPFGLKVSPHSSPVSPERFSGYHTGVDFETFADEQDAEVPVFAVCDGTLVEKRFASGYGGVAVQSCRLDNQDITVVYGHLKLVSVSAKAGSTLTAGEQLGVLGKGYSSETDGERKHLHLGIHIGKAVNLAGYVKTPAELSSWLNILKYLK
ncbi:MAG: M23 family metallopeptidase [Patescibacteria group bacterium]|nr:M23 family metallopeptidase [Patescibacteria group bacterium]